MIDLTISGNQLSGCVPSALQDRVFTDSAYTAFGGLPFR